MEEKIRRINVYSEGFFLTLKINVFIANQQKIKPRIESGLELSLKDSMDRYEQWIKERGEADATFSGLIAEIKIHFKDSVQLRKLLEKVSKQILVDSPKPDQKDFEAGLDSLQKWADRTSKTTTDYFDVNVRKPLDDLANYLENNINENY